MINIQAFLLINHLYVFDFCFLSNGIAKLSVKHLIARVYKYFSNCWQNGYPFIIKNQIKKMTHWMEVKTQSQTEMPSARWGHSMCSVGENIFLFGGHESPNYFNDLWKFDLNTLKFTQIEQKGQVPPPCSNFTMNLSQDQTKFLLFGGVTLKSKKLNSVYQFDIYTSTWKKLTFDWQQPQPLSRSYHCSQIIGNYLVIFGGEFFHDLSDLWLFDLEKCTWRQVKIGDNQIKPTARKFMSSFQYKNRLYLIGGCNTKIQSLSHAYCLDMAKFLQTHNLEDIKWRELKFTKNEGINRWGHVSVVKDNKAYIFGGRQGNKDLQNLIAIDLISQKCSEIYLIGQPPKGRIKPAVCLRNSTLFCHSGFDKLQVKDFFQINLLTKPKYNRKQYFSEDLQLQKQLNASNIQSQPKYQIIYDDNILKLINKKQRDKRRRKIKPNVAKPLSTQQFASFFSQTKQLKNSQYFQFLKKQSFTDQQFKIYRPADTTEDEYLELLQTFIIYLRCGKIFFSQSSIQQCDKLIENLLELADYYGIHHLEYIIKQQLLNDFQKILRSKKGQVKKLVQTTYKLQKYDDQLGQYAGFHTLLKLIKRSNVTKVDQLKVKLQNIAYLIDQISWLLELISKYQFQLQQYALNKSKIQSENNFPELIEENHNQKDDAPPKQWANIIHVP